MYENGWMREGRRKLRWRVTRTLESLVPWPRGTLHYIHIGKCGGDSLWEALLASKRIKRRFKRLRRTHVRKPVYEAGTKYVFVVRNPIERALSAFNWRYRLVVEEGTQKTRIEGEYEALRKYGTLEALALALYDGETLNERVAEEFRTIHHLREDIHYYLGECFSRISPNQVYAVLCQKTLDADIHRFIGVRNDLRVNENRQATPPERLALSRDARARLGEFLREDYECLARLNEFFPLEKEKADDLMRV